MTRADIGDYIASNVQDPISRTSTASATYSSSARSTPCASGSIPPSSTTTRSRRSMSPAPSQAQNVQVAAGRARRPAVGQGPAAERHHHRPQSRCRRPEQFGNILLRVNTRRLAGAPARRGARRARRRELRVSTQVQRPAGRGPRASSSLPGANALDTAKAVKPRCARAWRRTSRPACKATIPFDTTPFVRISIEEVVKTLFEAIVLVFWSCSSSCRTSAPR